MNNVDKIMGFFQNSMGFSWKGFLVFLLPMIPNVLFFILPNPNGSSTPVNKHILLDIIEHVSQAVFFMLLMFVISKKQSPMLCGYTIFMAILLLSYYGFWIAYFKSGANFILLMLMAIFPVTYFILAELWLHNFIAMIPLIIFGITHILITYVNYCPSHV